MCPELVGCVIHEWDSEGHVGATREMIGTQRFAFDHKALDTNQHVVMNLPFKPALQVIRGYTLRHTGDISVSI